MNSRSKIARTLVYLGVLLLQVIMTQVVTFFLSLLFPDLEYTQQNQPLLFVIFLGLTFAAGIYMVGVLALRQGWLGGKPRYAARLLATLAGANLPLVASLIFYRYLEPGHPSFILSILVGIMGFHFSGYLDGA
jgi:hypothetical protein